MPTDSLSHNQPAAEGSSHVTQDSGGGAANQNHNVLNQRPESKWHVGLLGASIVVNVVCLMGLFWDKQEKRIDEEYHIQTQGSVDSLKARLEQLEKAGPVTIIVRHEISKEK